MGEPKGSIPVVARFADIAAAGLGAVVPGSRPLCHLAVRAGHLAGPELRGGAFTLRRLSVEPDGALYLLAPRR